MEPNSSEVLSDQFDHFKLILFWVPEGSFCKKNQQNGIKWEFFGAPKLGGEGGMSPTWEKFPHFPVIFFWQRPLSRFVNFF